ncbi:MAG: hypothetical protein ACPGF7_01755 [Pontibacterium sp.]
MEYILIAAAVLAALIIGYYRACKPAPPPVEQKTDEPETKIICFSTIADDGNIMRIQRVIRADADVPTMSEAYAEHLRNEAMSESSRQEKD